MKRKACKVLCLYCLSKWLGGPVGHHEVSPNETIYFHLYWLGPMCRMSISLQQAFMLWFTTTKCTKDTKDTKLSVGLSINVVFV